MIVSISKLPDPDTSESTTTPIGLNHKTLSFASISSGLSNKDPTPPRIAKVINIRTKAVSELTIIFLVLVRKLSAFDQIDCLSDI